MTEINRKIAYKRIAPPGSTPSADGSGSGEVKVPVITEITFRDPVDRGQETTYTVDNSGKAWRDVHVAWVSNQGTTGATETPDLSQPTPADCVAVERLDKWRVKDPVDRGQQTQPQFDNKTYDPNGPPFFTTHKKTHVVRYINQPDDGNWVNSELIDQINFKDPVERGQQAYYTLQNPPGNTNINGLILGTVTDDNGNDIPTVAIDPNVDMPDITESPDSNFPADPPYRLDPFQNIVEVSGGYFIKMEFGSIDWAYNGFPAAAVVNKEITAFSFPVTPPPDTVAFTWIVAWTFYPALMPFFVHNSTSVNFPEDPESAVKLLNDANTTSFSFPIYNNLQVNTVFSTPPESGTGYATFDGQSFGVPFGITNEVLANIGVVTVNGPLNDHVRTFIFRLIDPTKNANFNISGATASLALGINKVIMPFSATFHNADGGTTIDSGDFTQSQGLDGGPGGVSSLTVTVVSAKDYRYDKNTQQLVLIHPNTDPLLPNPPPSMTSQTVLASGAVVDSTVGALRCILVSKATLKIAIKEIPDPTDSTKTVKLPIVWIASPEPITANGQQFGSYQWQGSIGDKLYRFSPDQPVLLGQPPPDVAPLP